MTNLYGCLYWYNEFGINLMRGYLSDLMRHAEHLNEEGMPWKVETFEFSAIEDETP